MLNRRSFGIPVLALLAVSLSAQTNDRNPRDTGPKTLVIAYRCAPAKRVALREYMTNNGLGKFEQWKREGVLGNYRLLFSRYVDADTWDMMAVLTFRQHSDLERWKEVEKVAPAGLSEEALILTNAVNTYPADLIRSRSTPSATAKPVFFVIPYDYTVSSDSYIKYVEGYVLPQLEGWIDEGVLVSYGIYLSRYQASRPWGALFILEYKNGEAFGLREKTIAKVRDRLKENPSWKALSEDKQNIRIEKQAVIADDILLP